MIRGFKFPENGYMLVCRCTSSGQLIMRDEIDIPIDSETRAKLEDAGKLSLNDKQLRALKLEIEEYALQRESELAVRPSVLKRRRWAKIEKDVAKLIEGFGDLRLKLSSATGQFDEATAMNDEIMFDSADVDEQKFLRDLLQLKAYLEKERLRRSTGGRPPDVWLGNFLDSLASLYVEAGGRSAAVSRDAANERKSTFIDFVWVAMQLLPRPCRPHSKQALAGVWEKQRNANSPP
jgi:hypothetical protein